MLILLLLFFLSLVFFFVIKFATMVTAMVAVAVSVTTISILACVWVGTSYYLKEQEGYKPKTARKSYHQVDSGLKEISEDLQEIRSQLAEVEPHLRDLEFLKYAPQNTEVKKSET